MPTVITKTIGSAGGRDYSTIQAFFNAVPADLVAADQQWIGECYNDSAFGSSGSPVALSLGARTTDATRNVILRCATGQGFSEDAGRVTNPLWFDQAQGVYVFIGSASGNAFDVVPAYTQIEGLQLHWIEAGGPGGLELSGTGSFAKNCIMYADITGTSLQMMKFTGAGAKGINCFLYGIATWPANIKGFWSSSTNELHNCTVYLNGIGQTDMFGVYAHAGTMAAKNTVSVTVNGQSFLVNFGAFTGSDHNASNDGTAPGTGSITSLVAANAFVSVTADLRPKAASALIAAGAAPQSDATLDIIGQTRDSSTPVIGAWEYGASVSTTQYWNVPTDAADGQTGTMVILADNSASVVDSGAVTAASSKFRLQCANQGTTVGSKKLAVVHNWDGSTSNVDMKGGPSIATVVAV